MMFMMLACIIFACSLAVQSFQLPVTRRDVGDDCEALKTTSSSLQMNVLWENAKDAIKTSGSLIKKSMHPLIATPVGLSLAACFVYYESEYRINREILSVFENGRVPGGKPVFVKRPELELDLQALMSPDEDDHKYRVIIGDEGTGKSTAIRDAIRLLVPPKAVVYCEVGGSKSFVTDVAEAIGYRTSFSPLDRVRRVIKGEGYSAPPLTWNVLQKRIDEVSRLSSKPLVIVLDSADRLFEEDPEFFLSLQRDAKAAADHGSPIYIFVLTRGRGLDALRSRSEWSRAAPPFQVGDVSDEQAVELLLKQHGTMKRSDAEEAVRTITGGRFHLLNAYPASDSVEENLSMQFDGTRASLAIVGLEPTHPLFALLYSSTSKVVSKHEAIRLLGQSHLDKLLETKILSIRANRSYTFNSRHVETFFDGE
jgi:hypothetical protein